MPHAPSAPLALPSRTALQATVLLAVFAALAGGALVGCDTDAEASTLPDEGFVEVNGATIYYQAEGDADDPTMVFVHGYPSTTASSASSSTGSPTTTASSPSTSAATARARPPTTTPRSRPTPRTCWT